MRDGEKEEDVRHGNGEGISESDDEELTTDCESSNELSHCFSVGSDGCTFLSKATSVSLQIK